MTRRAPQRRWCNKPRIRQAQERPHSSPLARQWRDRLSLPCPQRRPAWLQPTVDRSVAFYGLGADGALSQVAMSFAIKQTLCHCGQPIGVMRSLAIAPIAFLLRLYVSLTMIILFNPLRYALGCRRQNEQRNAATVARRVARHRRQYGADSSARLKLFPTRRRLKP